MAADGSRVRLDLTGSFRLSGSDGEKLEIPSKRGMALVAMVATGNGMTRTRSWLQDRLWGSRAQPQAQASLRRELSNLRKRLDDTVLQSNHERVWLDPAAFELVIAGKGEFLEGLDIAGEEGFEDWLRGERTTRRASFAAGAVPTAAAPVAVPGFAGRPTLAVLPFANHTGNPDNAYLAEGISDDLIDRLSRLRWLPVIASSSSFLPEHRNAGAHIVGRALGARYLLEGRLRGADARFELTATLTDTANGHVLWTNRVALAQGFNLGMVEQLTRGLVGALDARIDDEEQRRALHHPDSDASVSDLIWRGRWHLNRSTNRDAEIARGYFEQALAREPHSPEALVQYAWVRLFEIWSKRRSETELRDVRQIAQRAITADRADGRAYALAGMAEMWSRQPARAETLLLKALSLNPSFVLAYTELGSTYYLSDRPAEAIPILEAAIPLSPADHRMFGILADLAISHLMLGNWDAAIDHADRALALREGYWFSHAIKINALVGRGDVAAATTALDALLLVNPDFDVAFVDWVPFVDGQWNDKLKAGIRAAQR
jgi:TolB-like protein